MEKYKICPFCKKKNTTKAPECIECGTSLTGVKPTDDATEAARAEAEAQKSEEHNQFVTPVQHAGQMIRICSECGTHNLANARKCSNCGEDISDVIPTEETDVIPQPEKACKYMLHSYDGSYVYEVPGTGCTLGRENDMSDYLSGKGYVSRRHAILTIEDGKLQIENVSSTNFTYVNNVKISGKTELKIGDEVGLGGNLSGGKRQDLAAYFIIKQD